MKTFASSHLLGIWFIQLWVCHLIITSTLNSDSASEKLAVFILPLTISRDHWQRNPVVETKITFYNYLLVLSSKPGLRGFRQVHLTWITSYQNGQNVRRLCSCTLDIILVVDYQTQLSNLRWMPNSVRIGFGPAMKTGSSRRFKWYPQHMWASFKLASLYCGLG